MATFDETVKTFEAEMDRLGISYDHNLFMAVTKGLGPSIYSNDASRVSCSDKTEMERVRTNFLIGKLGCADGPKLEAALTKVCEQMGTSNRNKYRACFYYLLVKELKKESVYA